MRLKEIYQYQYDQLIETLDVEFSLHEDSDNSYRLISLIDLEITSYLSNPTILDEFSIEDLMEDIIIVEEIIENYIEINSDDLPKEEFI